MKYLKRFNEAKKPIITRSIIEVDQPSSKDDPGDKILMDLLDIVGSIGHDDIPFTLDWSDDDSNILWKDYLVKTYGDEIKNHEEFILKCY